MFTMYTFCRSELMYTKCIQNVCIQNISHISNFCVYKIYPTFQIFVYILYTKCIQNVYKMFVYKMYPTFQQSFVYILYTKFSWHSSFDFVYKMYTKACQNVVYILHTFCIYFAYISCIHLVQFLYTKCIHSFRVGGFFGRPYRSNGIKTRLGSLV